MRSPKNYASSARTERGRKRQKNCPAGSFLQLVKILLGRQAKNLWVDGGIFGKKLKT